MKNWKFFLTSVLCASLVFGFASCSNGSDDSGALLAVAGGGTNTTAPTAPTNPTTPTTPTTPKTAVTYTITFNANDGSENPATSTQSFTEGTSQALKTISELGFSKGGFSFAGWGKTADATESAYADGASYTATAAATLYAIWSAIPVYSVNVSPNANGNVTASPATGIAGTEITLSNTPKTGYKFDSYTVTSADGTTVTVMDGKFTMPEGNVTVKAVFSIITYAITIADGMTNGTVSADVARTAADEIVTLTISPNEGYELDSLTVVAEDNINVGVVTVNETTKTFVMPNKNVIINANFKETPISAYKVLPAGTDGTAGPTGTYVTFGAWPQTIKAEEVTVDEGISKTVGMYTYCKGSDGSWYVKQAEYGCGSNWTVWKYSDGTIVGNDGTTEKWFKVEPIKWRVLTNNYNGKKLLFAENSLINCAYYDCEGNDPYKKDYTTRFLNPKIIYSNNYEHSRIRAYLNGLSYQSKFGENSNQKLNSEFLNRGFLQTAFTEEEMEKIVDTNVDNSARSTYPCDNVTIEYFSVDENNKYACSNTVDKIFCLSVQEITNDEYGLRKYYERQKQGRHTGCERYCTDFDMANGALLYRCDSHLLYAVSCG